MGDSPRSYSPLLSSHGGNIDITSPVKLRIERVPSVFVCLFLAPIVICHFIYQVKINFVGYLPPIADISMGEPESSIFSGLLSFSSAFLLLPFSLLTSWGEIYGFFFDPVLSFMRFLCDMNAVCILGIASSVETDAIPWFIGCLYISLVLILAALIVVMWNRMNGWFFVRRLIYISISSASLVIAFIKALPLTLTSSFELAFIASISCLILTLEAELKTIRAEFILSPQ